jgi:hypothetical protein
MSCYSCSGSNLLQGNTCKRTCDPGYVRVVSESRCIRCPTNYIYDTTNGICVTCKPHEKANLNDNRCDDCKQHQFFNETSLSCSDCANGYLFNRKLYSCVLPPKHSYYIAASESIVSCDSKSESIIGGCRVCTSLGSYFLNSSNDCQECESGKIEDGNNGCKFCSVGFKPDHGNNRCTFCGNAQYYTVNNQTCTPCGAN